VTGSAGRRMLYCNLMNSLQRNERGISAKYRPSDYLIFIADALHIEGRGGGVLSASLNSAARADAWESKRNSIQV
jgi:hypothetical protein